MSITSHKKQVHFTEPAQIDAILSDQGAHDRETVRLLKLAMGRKLKPLHPVAIPADPQRMGPYSDINYVTAYPALVPSRLRDEIDLVAEWIKSAQQTDAAWLRKYTPDGRIAVLSRGFDKAAAEARKFFYGTKQKRDVNMSPTTRETQTITYIGEGGYSKTVHSHVPPGPLSGPQMTAILSHRIPDRLKIAYNRYSYDPELAMICPEINFTVEGVRSNTITRWTCNPTRGVTQFMGWNGSGITKQLMANRLALYKAMGCEEINSSFSNIGKYAFARYGFVPQESDWRRISGDVLGKLDSAAKEFGLHDEVKQDITKILLNPDPRAMWEFADYQYKADDKPLALALMDKMPCFWSGTLNLQNPEQAARVRDYVGHDVFDDAMLHAEHVMQTVPATPDGSVPTGFRYRSPSAGPA